jgi:hypothetical protein
MRGPPSLSRVGRSGPFGLAGCRCDRKKTQDRHRLQNVQQRNEYAFRPPASRGGIAICEGERDRRRERDEHSQHRSRGVVRQVARVEADICKVMRRAEGCKRTGSDAANHSEQHQRAEEDRDVGETERTPAHRDARQRRFSDAAALMRSHLSTLNAQRRGGMGPEHCRGRREQCSKGHFKLRCADAAPDYQQRDDEREEPVHGADGDNVHRVVKRRAGERGAQPGDVERCEAPNDFEQSIVVRPRETQRQRVSARECERHKRKNEEPSASWGLRRSAEGFKNALLWRLHMSRRATGAQSRRPRLPSI